MEDFICFDDGIDISPEETHKFLKASEMLANGIPEAEETLKECVKSGIITQEEFERTVKKCKEKARLQANKDGKTKEKQKSKPRIFGYTIEEWLSVLSFLIHVGAIGVVLCSIPKPNLLTIAAAVFLLISFWLNHYSNVEEKRQKDYKIAELKNEISRLESDIKSDEHIIELLNKQLEKVHTDSQQE